jgi:hypothetical protein
MHAQRCTCYMISVPSGGLVPQTNPNQSVMNMFGIPKYTVNTCSERSALARNPAPPSSCEPIPAAIPHLVAPSQRPTSRYLPHSEVIPSPLWAHTSQWCATTGQALQKCWKLAFPRSQAPASILTPESQACSWAKAANTGACTPRAQGWPKPPSQTHPELLICCARKVLRANLYNIFVHRQKYIV